LVLYGVDFCWDLIMLIGFELHWVFILLIGYIFLLVNINFL